MTTGGGSCELPQLNDRPDDEIPKRGPQTDVFLGLKRCPNLHPLDAVPRILPQLRPKKPFLALGREKKSQSRLRLGLADLTFNAAAI